jgi:hypothetical protein
MIAAAGAWRLAQGETSDWDSEAKDNLPFPGLVSADPPIRLSAESR